MEFLKNKIIIAILFTASISFAQTGDLYQAFKKSYEYEKNNEAKKAANELKTVYVSHQDSYELNLRLGWLNYKAGVFTESIIYYSRAVNLKPYSIEAKFGLIYPLSAMGKWTDVEKTYLEILKLDSKNTVASYKLALLYFGYENYNKALVYLENVVNLYPFDYDSNLMLAWTYLRLGKQREAKILFEKVLLISPNDASAKEGLSYIK